MSYQTIFVIADELQIVELVQDYLNQAGIGANHSYRSFVPLGVCFSGDIEEHGKIRTTASLVLYSVNSSCG
jgi:hypothetical protein